MKLIRWLATMGVLSNCLGAVAGEVIPSVPDSPNKAARYLIYLHGSGIDRDGVNRAKENFRAITQRLADRGATVIAEIRPQGAIRRVPEDLDAYARKVAAQVEKLLKAQVPPRSITIVGFSRGGVMALMASNFVGDPEVGYVILGGACPRAARSGSSYQC